MRNMLEGRDIVVAAYSELPRLRHGRLTALQMAGMVCNDLLGTSHLGPAEIDGLAVTTTLSQTTNPFWSNFVADALGLSPTWLQCTDLGGCSPLANVARASAAILTGQCEIVMCLAADAPSLGNVSNQGGYKTEFAEPAGYAGPVSTFGLISSVYGHLHGYPHAGLAKLAVHQRLGGRLNPHTPRELSATITEADYLASRIVAAPLRLLDCVMQCDGGSGLIVTTADRARALGVERPVFPVAYAEVTNLEPADPIPDITRTGFTVVGPRVLAMAGLGHADIRMFQPYDDFLIAVALQLEDIGFCPRGGAGRFLEQTDIGPAGRLPINTGGGQISSGQPGLAGGSVNLIEAIRQLRQEASGRQVPTPANALVTGIGSIQYARNWGTSNAMVLSR